MEEVKQEVQTAPEEVTPEEAKQLLDSQVGWVYLDVRTQAEFLEGHVPGAWHIPIMITTADGSEKVTNDSFLAVVKANLDKGVLVIVGCRSGGRSGRARKIMQEAGYRAVANMVGGWVSGADSTGATVPGWSKRGYPIEHGDGGEKSYAKLASKLKP